MADHTSNSGIVRDLFEVAYANSYIIEAVRQRSILIQISISKQFKILGAYFYLWRNKGWLMGTSPAKSMRSNHNHWTNAIMITLYVQVFWLCNCSLFTQFSTPQKNKQAQSIQYIPIVEYQSICKLYSAASPQHSKWAAIKHAIIIIVYISTELLKFWDLYSIT